MSIYQNSALHLLEKHGYAEARRKCIQGRDMNSLGTASYAFHNATLKALEQIHRDYDGATYCSHGHKTKASCDCEPIAANE